MAFHAVRPSRGNRQASLLLALAAHLSLPAPAAAQPAEINVPSCVSGSPGMTLPVTTEQAMLDPKDRARFQQAAEARYPLYQRGGMVPAEVLLLRRGGRWVYVSLWRQGHRGTCFAALFAAERFDFTPGWLQKYRPSAIGRDD
jgi:hypothetical protein